MKNILLAFTLVATLNGCAIKKFENIYTSSCGYQIEEWEKPLTFGVIDGIAYASGIICEGSPDAFNALVNDHPAISMIKMGVIDGSADDYANLELAHTIREMNIATHLSANSSVASGGTDLFLAGVTRTIEDGAKIGVHSWAAGDIQGHQLPKNSPEHQMYLDYYQEMGIPTDFYWFTLEVAPANQMHQMTKSEIQKYGLATN
ncbi:alpha/beta hydrolase [Vibrio tapetis subsp. quintayensis]|uniref:COG3904 family protein n=1 Tax=Vibrio tapetis TaxID=52443 RepID=UPI0025B60C61|nr:alpha/beta hydrolase [Vibrio tapetis]MDN3681250.1 alpha/beta hydrolase [Vibrio tapetis subsp. quintayensis]